jgi:hypothetical protein
MAASASSASMLQRWQILAGLPVSRRRGRPAVPRPGQQLDMLPVHQAVLPV